MQYKEVKELAAIVKFLYKLTVSTARLAISPSPIHNLLSHKRKDKYHFLKIKDLSALLKEEMMLKIVKNRFPQIRMILMKIFKLTIMKK